MFPLLSPIHAKPFIYSFQIGMRLQKFKCQRKWGNWTFVLLHASTKINTFIDRFVRYSVDFVFNTQSKTFNDEFSWTVFCVRKNLSFQLKVLFLVKSILVIENGSRYFAHFQNAFLTHFLGHGQNAIECTAHSVRFSRTFCVGSNFIVL